MFLVKLIVLAFVSSSAVVLHEASRQDVVDFRLGGVSVSDARQGAHSDLEAADHPWKDFHFRDCRVHSNLGGFGPQQGAEDMVIQNVTTSTEGKVVNLRIKASESYEAGDASLNGVHHNYFGVINMRGNTRAEFRFELVDAETGRLTTVPAFHFTFYDIDAGRGAAREHVSIEHFKDYWVSNTTDLRITHHSDESGNTTFSSTERGRWEENPQGPHIMTQQELNRAVTVLFEDRDSFTVTVSLPRLGHPRNLIFGGVSLLAHLFDPSYAVTSQTTTANPHGGRGGMRRGRGNMRR